VQNLFLNLEHSVQAECLRYLWKEFCNDFTAERSPRLWRRVLVSVWYSIATLILAAVVVYPIAVSIPIAVFMNRYDSDLRLFPHDHETITTFLKTVLLLYYLDQYWVVVFRALVWLASLSALGLLFSSSNLQPCLQMCSTVCWMAACFQIYGTDIPAADDMGGDPSLARASDNVNTVLFLTLPALILSIQWLIVSILYHWWG